jgi:hypothetical protein
MADRLVVGIYDNFDPELHCLDMQMPHGDVAGLEFNRCFDMGFRAGLDVGFDCRRSCLAP